MICMSVRKKTHENHNILLYKENVKSPQCKCSFKVGLQREEGVGTLFQAISSQI